MVIMSSTTSLLLSEKGCWWLQNEFSEQEEEFAIAAGTLQVMGSAKDYRVMAGVSGAFGLIELMMDAELIRNFGMTETVKDLVYGSDGRRSLDLVAGVVLKLVMYELQAVVMLQKCDDDDGLQDCALKINAPNLVSFTYHGWVEKEYFLSSFQTLESASVWLCVPRGRKIGAATISVADEFVNIVPIFHNLEKLLLELEVTIDKSVFPLLKAAPNLTHLEFNEISTQNL
ncbi:hypothetical protein C5167_005414 [Papaver somniferum]|uniref:Uncharacterized protein n=1 Tax=Papaver somniferum TaxID=3469 RepID=A0A4Y7JBB9_PAPSO|nr:hypothetical protein C5167_005414 [Papaver somniferum]